MKTSLLVASLASLATLAASPAWAQDVIRTEQVAVAVKTVADGLSHPWSLAFLPGGDLLVTERPGRLRIISEGQISEPVEGLPEIAARGQGGLLDVAVAADFAQTGTIFFSFSEPGEDGAGTAIARGRLVTDGDTPRLEEVETIFSMSKKSGRGQHFGSRIVLHPDGTLFFTIGDRGERDRAQDMQDHAGAVLRIAPDGSIPADNPSPDGAAHLPEIWSKGHRNPQGAAFDPLTGGIVVNEHGDKGGDEINYPQAGLNYGWPVISYGVTYGGETIGVGSEAEGYQQPAHYWDPSIAPSGMAVYEGEMFPEWKGDLLVGALSFQLVSRLERDAQGAITGEERMFEGAFGRIRDVRLAPDGSVFLLTDAENGSVIRLSRAD